MCSCIRKVWRCGACAIPAGKSADLTTWQRWNLSRNQKCSDWATCHPLVHVCGVCVHVDVHRLCLTTPTSALAGRCLHQEHWHSYSSSSSSSDSRNGSSSSGSSSKCGQCIAHSLYTSRGVAATAAAHGITSLHKPIGGHITATWCGLHSRPDCLRLTLTYTCMYVCGQPCFDFVPSLMVVAVIAAVTAAAAAGADACCRAAAAAVEH